MMRIGGRASADPSGHPSSLLRVIADYWHISEAGSTCATAIPANIHVQARRGSLVAFVPPQAGKPPAFIKIHSSKLLFRNEYSGLSLAEGMADERGNVKTPAILRSNEHELAVVTEFVQGVPFSSTLRRHYLALPRTCSSGMLELGRWLARYHQSRRETSMDNHHVDRYVGAIIGGLDKGKRWLGSPRYASALMIVDEIRKSLRPSPKSLRQCHGDFTIGNILTNDDCFYVIDFAASGLGLPELDMITFRSSLASAVGFLPFSGSAVQVLWSAFLKGYRSVERIESDTHATVRDLCELYVLTHSLGELFDYPSLDCLRRLWKAYRFLQTVSHLRSWIDGPGSRHLPSG